MIGGLVLDLLFTLGATFALFGKLRVIDDMFDVSLEIRSVGTSVLLALGKLVGFWGWESSTIGNRLAHAIFIIMLRLVVRTVSSRSLGLLVMYLVRGVS